MKIFLLFIICIFLAPKAIFAHPLDISTSTYTIQGHKVYATTYFHTYQAERLLRTNNINLNTSEDYYKNSRIFEKYIQDRALVLNNGRPCKIQNISLIQKEMYDIISEGLGVEYEFFCDAKITKITIDLLFFNEYELQTNRLRIYEVKNGNATTSPLVYKVLNPLVHSYTQDLSDNTIQKLIDTDGDIIPDEEERIYRTDPLKVDTDGDYYTDYEEVSMGWNPIKASPGPGQKIRNMPPETPESYLEEMKQLKSSDEYDSRYIKQTNLLDTGFGNAQLRDTLKTITEKFKNLTFGSFGYIFFMVVLLGFIHAIGPGHSKGFLVSYILDKEKGFFQGLIFVTVFSLVHLADIIFLFFLTKLFFSLADPTEFMVIIQRISIIVLFFFSLFMLIQSIQKLRSKKKILKNDTNNLGGSGIFLAFVAGLAPCSFGWSIFLILFSMGKVIWILPLLFALAAGIWLCLFCILIITLFFRDRLYGKFSALPHYSSLASASILLGLSIYLYVLVL